MTPEQATAEAKAWAKGWTDPQSTVTARYAHPQGKSITVFSDGSMLCLGPDGRKKPTSADPEKLADGFGQWVRVQ